MRRTYLHSHLLGGCKRRIGGVRKFGRSRPILCSYTARLCSIPESVHVAETLAMPIDKEARQQIIQINTDAVFM